MNLGRLIPVAIVAVMIPLAHARGSERTAPTKPATNTSKLPARIVKLAVEPAAITLTAPGEGMRVLVMGITSNGEKVDLTASARLRTLDNSVKVDKDGFLYAVAPGTTVGGRQKAEGGKPGSAIPHSALPAPHSTKVLVAAAGQKAELAVTVQALEAPRVPSFVRDVMPVLNKIGCTSGVCHGSAKGRNGFKLSLRGYDPEFDYRTLLYDTSGRRINRVDAARSLMLAKPTQQVAHGGGLRIELGSRYYQKLLDWISAGAPLGDVNSDKPSKLEVLPAEIFTSRTSARQQMLVLAHYPDGSLRDVTREAVFASTAPEVAEVSPSAVVTTQRKGETSVLARYEGRFVIVPVTVVDARPGFVWTALAEYNYIDQHIDAKLKRLKILPAPPADDTEFLRRVSLDLIGIPPRPEEVRAFLADPADSRTKRSRLIDRLMARPEFVDRWALKWGDLLQNSRKYMGDKGMWAFREWIRDAVARNKPYDQMVRELLTSTGSTYENPPANFFRGTPDPKLAMEKTSQLFLGVRMVCAQCHDHPFEQWTQNNYYELAAFFSAVGVKPGFDSDEEIVYEKRDDYEVKHPKDGRVVEPRFLVVGAGFKPAPTSNGANRRQALVEWLTSPQNPFFARAIANRVWSYFFSRGIIEPVDDIRATNPPSNEALLAALARDLTEHNYDLQHIIRTIVNSRAYQASYRANEWNADDQANFSHALPRRLTAEQLLDSVVVAAGSRIKFPEVPPDFRAEQLPGPHVGMGGFLDLFGRPQRETPCECERRSDMSLPQALNLINGPTIAEALADPDGRVAKLILAGAPDDKLVQELYLAALARLPDAKESEAAIAYLKRGSSRAARAQDLLWALLNSNAFLFNR